MPCCGDVQGRYTWIYPIQRLRWWLLRWLWWCLLTRHLFHRCCILDVKNTHWTYFALIFTLWLKFILEYILYENLHASVIYLAMCLKIKVRVLYRFPTHGRHLDEIWMVNRFEKIDVHSDDEKRYFFSLYVSCLILVVNQTIWVAWQLTVYCRLQPDIIRKKISYRVFDISIVLCILQKYFSILPLF